MKTEESRIKNKLLNYYGSWVYNVVYIAKEDFTFYSLDQASNHWNLSESKFVFKFNKEILN